MTTSKCKKQRVKKKEWNAEILAAIGYHIQENKERQLPTNVIIHGSALEEVPLDPRCGVKVARMVRSPFIVGDEPFSIARDKE